MKKTIDLDCSPGNPRPDKLIEGVIKDTGLPLKDPVSKFVGNFMWDYSELSDEEWMRIQPILKKRILKLHKRGVIRYGSW
jgi:hypothetical protein